MAVLALNGLGESRRDAALKTELLRVCDLVRKFEAKSNRFPTTLDEVGFEASGRSVRYFPHKLSASVFLKDPAGGSFQCFIHGSVDD